jgi:hypothetical protein
MVIIKSQSFIHFVTIHFTDSCIGSCKMFMNSVKISQLSLQLNDMFSILSYEVYFHITNKEIIME